jgi:hypothetical protein
MAIDFARYILAKLERIAEMKVAAFMFGLTIPCSPQSLIIGPNLLCEVSQCIISGELLLKNRNDKRINGSTGIRGTNIPIPRKSQPKARYTLLVRILITNTSFQSLR